jgi:hypothetical protein
MKFFDFCTAFVTFVYSITNLYSLVNNIDINNHKIIESNIDDAIEFTYLSSLNYTVDSNTNIFDNKYDDCAINIAKNYYNDFYKKPLFAPETNSYKLNRLIRDRLIFHKMKRIK